MQNVKIIVRELMTWNEKHAKQYFYPFKIISPSKHLGQLSITLNILADLMCVCEYNSDVIMCVCVCVCNEINPIINGIAIVNDYRASRLI